jgi:hypothetical protein
VCVCVGVCVCVLFPFQVHPSLQMLKYASSITRESIIDVYGCVKLPSSPVMSCSQQNVELHVDEVCVRVCVLCYIF